MSQSAPVFTALVRVPYGLPKGAKAVLTAAATLTRRRLYIALDGWPASLSIASLLAKLQAVYQHVAHTQPKLDVRVLLPCAGSPAAAGAPELAALIGPPGEEDRLTALNEARAALHLAPLAFVALEAAAIADAAAVVSDAVAPSAAEGDDHGEAPSFAHVCVGGTFDYIHMGHKLLLSIAAYCTSERLVCGVSDAPLLGKKTLRELMQPVALRMALVEDFLRSIKPGIALQVSALQDGYGPATRDAALEAIVVSAETAKGGEACNTKRSAGAHSEGVVLPPLALVAIPLVAGDAAISSVSEDNKVRAAGGTSPPLLTRNTHTAHAAHASRARSALAAACARVHAPAATSAAHARRALGCRSSAHSVERSFVCR